MSKFSKSLDALNIHNSFNFFGEQPFISYRSQQIGRGYTCAAWLVHKTGVHLNDDHWRDYDAKGFAVYNMRDRETQLANAKAWAKKKFGIKEWARCPFGGYGDAAFIRQRTQELKEKLKAVRDGEA